MPQGRPHRFINKWENIIYSPRLCYGTVKQSDIEDDIALQIWLTNHASTFLHTIYVTYVII